MNVSSYVWFFRGLLSEKPDDTLFFLDVGQTEKAENKGKSFSVYTRMTKVLPLSRLKVFNGSVEWVIVCRTRTRPRRKR